MIFKECSLHPSPLAALGLRDYRALGPLFSDSMAFLRTLCRTRDLNSPPRYEKLSVGLWLSPGDSWADGVGQSGPKGCLMVSYHHPFSWSLQMPWIEYAHNSLSSAPRGMSLFMASLGYQPPILPLQEEDVVLPSLLANLWLVESGGRFGQPLSITSAWTEVMTLLP